MLKIFSDFIFVEKKCFKSSNLTWNYDISQKKYEEIEFGFIEKIDSEGFHEEVTEMIY